MRVVMPWTLVLVLAAGVVPAAGQPSVTLIVNGAPVSLTAPAYVQAGQVMLPAIRVFESFGAAAVWHPADRTVMVTNRTGLMIRLRIGEASATVNGEVRSLPVAPLVIHNQPYVPAVFVFAALGAWVRFDETVRTLHVASQITAMRARRTDDGVRVVLDATGPLRAETRTLANPDRLVVDLHGGAWRSDDREVFLGDAGVLRVRAAQFQVKPYITRVVFDLQQPVDARTRTATDSFAFTIEVRTRGQTPVVQRPAEPAATGPALAPGPEGPSALPPPVVAPPPAAPAPSTADPIPPPDYDPDRPSTHEAPGLLPDPVPDDGIPRIRQVRTELLGTRFRVLVEGTLPLQYVVRELPDPDRLVVDVEGAIFLPVKQTIPVVGGVVTEVRAAQFQTDPHITRVVVEMRHKVAYTVSAGADGGQTIVVEIPEMSFRGHVVAIDAGHGGRDPGAIGPTGLVEKDVNLDIAQRVRELLVRSGIRVVMTREADVSVELPDRPRMARRQGATVFVSIHGNASTRPAASGSETYYLTPQSQVLAQLVQEELGRVPNLISRGVKTANFLVLRENDMPAVLVEVAFLSNVDEEARLRQSEFRQRLAEAVSRGVRRFLAVYPVPAN
jgi:N-acetylmuramoyl-L-alanine amidase